MRGNLKPFTVEHFEAYTGNLVLDTGDYWKLEDFQAEIVDPLFWFIRNEVVGECWDVLPEGNAKTTLFAGIALYCADYARLPWIPIAAASRDQASILLTQARNRAIVKSCGLAA